MKAIVLAGGFGTRMRPLTFSTPKPLLCLLNKPIIVHILDYLHDNGISEVIITTNYLREVIQECVGENYREMKIQYPHEDKPLGTAGCVKNIAGQLDDTFLIIQGDCITDMSLKRLIESHRYYSGLATIATYHVEEPWKYGVVEAGDDGRVKQFQEKPPAEECRSCQANTGVYVLEPEALEFIPEDTKFDFAKNLFPILLERESIFACSYDSGNFWVDVGQPKDYRRAHEWMMARLKQGIHESAVIDGKIIGPAVIGKDSYVGKNTVLYGPVLIGDNVQVEDHCVLRGSTSINDGSRIMGRTNLDGAIIYGSNTVGARNNISQALLGQNCVLKNKDIVQGDVIIGAGCVIEPDVYILEGSRVWPGLSVGKSSIIDGTLRKFVKSQDAFTSPRYALRQVSMDEAFYFNKKESNHIIYTGLRARSLLEFNRIIQEVDLSSLQYHLRDDINDFGEWVETIIGNKDLAEEMSKIKNLYSRKDIPARDLRKKLYAVGTSRLMDLIEEVNPPGYA